MCENKNYIDMSIGQCDHSGIDNIITTLFHAFQKNQIRYTDPKGIKFIRNFVAQNYIHNKHKLSFELSDYVTMTTGASGALSSVFVLLKSQGINKVIIPTPGYPGYQSILKSLNMNYSFYDTINVFNGLNIDELLNKWQKENSILLINSPNNPLGKTISKSVLNKICLWSNTYCLPLILDEAYSDIIFENSLKLDNVLNASCLYLYRILSFSKSHCLSGWRIGSIIAHPQNIEKISKIHYSLLMSAPTSGQIALYAYKNQHAIFLAQQLARIQERSFYIQSLLNERDINFHKPDGGIFLWVQELNTDQKLQKYLIKSNVQVMPGIHFGPRCENFFRITVDLPKQDIDEVFSRIDMKR